MANHKSAEKRARQNVTRNARNRSYVSSVKTAIKSFRSSVEGAKAAGTKPEELQKLFSGVQSILQKAASKGLVHKNNASRRIQRLAHLMANPK